jgi:hypothetical protein
LQAKVEDLTSTVSQLRDENMLLRAQANTSLGQVTDGSSVGHKTFRMLEEARAEGHRWKIESEQKDLLIRKLVSTLPMPSFLRRGSKAVCPMSQVCGM